MLDVDWKNKSVKEGWMEEEALASVSSALFVDATYSEDSDFKGEGKDSVIASLSFTSRVTNQIGTLQELLSGGFINRLRNLVVGNDTDGSLSESKDHSFGLAKVAVMLSNSYGKVMGVDTVSKGRVIWALSLNRKATWHKIVHGGATGRSSVFGHGMNHPHSHEILILSHYYSGQVEWHCVDGVNGRVISSDSTPSSSFSPVVQVVPIHGHSHGEGSCRQSAALVHENGSVSVIPNVLSSINEVSKSILGGGLYAHQVEKENGLFRSMKIMLNKDKNDDHLGKVVTIGKTNFDPKLEKIINVAYPQRNEVVQSPTTIMGDDSLLLKYLNPHLCVVVTEATSTLMSELEDDDTEIDKKVEAKRFYQTLGGGSNDSGTGGGSTKPKKKPLGVTNHGEEVPLSNEQTQETPEKVKNKSSHPTLFINLIDTVSGQNLYRISHSHTASDVQSSKEYEGVVTNVPVVISENWVVYAFPNYKTRRTEVGVLTLHEGMIDKHGITAFTSPDQQMTFASMSTPKPLVLTKTFGLAKPVSAIGVTNTKGGISAKNIVFATGVSGQIITFDRRLFDPRRPSGVPKVTEKKEGLMQYAPLMPISPMTTVSYTNNVEDATSIISAAANLESQSLLLAYGGPDIFFTRLAPSKGFDSLPETFNKLLLMLVLFALFVALAYVKSRAGTKSFSYSWS